MEEGGWIDRSAGNTNKLANELRAISENFKAAAEASDRHAGRLVWATWALALATLALVAVTGVHAYIAWCSHA